jgi:hypothetical protein
METTEIMINTCINMLYNNGMQWAVHIGQMLGMTKPQIFWRAKLDLRGQY